MSSVQSVTSTKQKSQDRTKSISPSTGSSVISNASIKSSTPEDDPDGTKPDFIYGGPFIEVKKPEPFFDMATPINEQLQGTFKKSFAYYSLVERLPIILTKVIDYLSREGPAIISEHKTTVDDVKGLIQYITKLKNDLLTNKIYDKLSPEAEDSDKWNQWIDGLEHARYFSNTWVWTECYVYRRLREGCELSNGLKNFDPFDQQKDNQFANSMEPMCVVADRLLPMLSETTKEQRKVDFVTLLKLALWSNKCDLSLTCGESTTLGGPGDPEETVPDLVDPFQMIVDFKDKVLADDSAKAYDQLINKTEAMKKAIAGNTVFKQKCSCHRLATLCGIPKCPDESEPAEESAPPAPPEAGENGAPEPPKIPCPAKMTIPQAVMFDIVCDNAGYELFTDLCIATFLVKQGIVQKIRFHVKRMPWFVSDVTPRDFNYVIESCKNASFSREIPPEPTSEEDEAPARRQLTSGSLRQLGDTWAQLVQDGTFILCVESRELDEKLKQDDSESDQSERSKVTSSSPTSVVGRRESSSSRTTDSKEIKKEEKPIIIIEETKPEDIEESDEFWTYPHVYKDMKKYDYYLYRKLQHAVAILFKGDLNYRKLLGERNCNPVQGFDPSLQGFNPAPIIAVRTIKADLVCGLPKGKWEALNKIDEKWMETGNYGVIQFSPKAEALKVADRPCLDYSDSCKGVTCPLHRDL